MWADIPINDRDVPYPLVLVDGYGYVPDPVMIEQHFQDCTKRGGQQGAAGCSGTVKFRAILKNWYEVSDRLIPPGALGNPPIYDAHHILPLMWGGTNQGVNGVFLTNHLTPTDLHQTFTTWWCGFSLDGRFYSAGPITDCGELE